MAQRIIIEKGNRQLQNVEKITPDTRVNQKANLEYPVFDLNNGVVKETFDEIIDKGESGETTYTFEQPHTYVDPDAESGESGETGTTGETGETESGTS